MWALSPHVLEVFTSLYVLIMCPMMSDVCPRVINLLHVSLSCSLLIKDDNTFYPS